MDDEKAILAAAWIEAKRAEMKAQEERYRIEEKIAAAFEVPAEGAKTHKIDGFKIVLDQPVYRKLDTDVWAKVRAKIPEALWPVKTKIEPDATGCKYLAANEPKAWKAIAAAFTAKPGKVSVKVEAI